MDFTSDGMQVIPAKDGIFDKYQESSIGPVRATVSSISEMAV